MKKLLLVFLLALTVSACNNDDDEPNCRATQVTMVINGEAQTFVPYGRGLSLTPNGYIMDINISRGSADPYSEQSFFIELPYNKKGHNVISRILYHQYAAGGVSIDGDFVNSDLQSEVISNNKNCFACTFSGKITSGDQEIVITDGIISYEYEEPYDN